MNDVITVADRLKPDLASRPTPQKFESSIKIAQNNTKIEPVRVPYEVQLNRELKIPLESYAPGTNYDIKNPKALKSIPLSELQAVLSRSLTSAKAKQSFFNAPVCDQMSALLANELNRKNIPYRVVDLKPAKSKDGLLHRCLRVFTKDKDGKDKWLIVDPTLGQWFKDGTVNRHGTFIPELQIHSGGQPPIFIGTHQELQSAVLKNFDRLDDAAKGFIDGRRYSSEHNGDRFETDQIFRNSGLTKDQKNAAAFVLIYYGRSNGIGTYKYQNNWKPANLNDNKTINAEIDEYYRHLSHRK